MYSPVQEVPGTPQIDRRRDQLDVDVVPEDALVPDDTGGDSADDSYSVPGTPVHRPHERLVSTPRHTLLNLTPSARTPGSHGDGLFRTPRPVLPSPLCDRVSTLKEQVVPSTPCGASSLPETTSSHNKTPRIIRSNVRNTPSPSCIKRSTSEKNRVLETVVDATGDHGPISVDTSRSRGRREAVARYRRSPDVMSSGQSSRRNIMDSPDFLDAI